MTYTLGATHGPLSGSGQITIASPAGLKLTLSTLPAYLGSAVGTPDRHFDVGRVAPGNADGFLPPIVLRSINQLIYPLPDSLTTLGYDVVSGASLQVQELVGVPLPDAAAYAAAVAALTAMTADRDAQVATLATRTTERDSARNSLYVGGTYLTGPTWQTQDATDLASLATRTTERDTARNGLYVSGTYLSGQTWQTKDATDLAAYNAEVTLYNTAEAARIVAVAALAAALAPSSSQRVHVDYSTGTIFPGVNVATLGGVPVNTLGATVSSTTITIPKSGRYEIHAVASALGSGSRVNNLQWWIYQNGTVLGSRTIDTMAGAYLKDAMEWEGPLAASDAIQVRFNPGAPANVQPEAYITLTFVPTAANPH